MKLYMLAGLAALATVRADSESDAMGLTVIDFDAMYAGECTAQPKPDSTSAADSSVSDSDYASNYDDFYKDSSFNTALCQCLLDSGVQSAVGPSAYATALKLFLDCVAKADSAETKRWSKYEHSLLPNANATVATTTAAAAQTDETAAADSETTLSSSEDSLSSSNVSDSAEWPFADLSSTEQSERASASTVANASVAVAVLMSGVDATDERFGHAAMYILFIGVSVLLFVCLWFVKSSVNAKWGKGGYDAVSYSSEADADARGDPYNHNAQLQGGNGNGDEWEDMYASSYDHDTPSNSNSKQNKKGKFAEWNQYNAV